jgi:membrane-associated phospholipid phosphatase
MNYILTIFTNFGRSGPFILIAFASYLLWNKSNLFFYYQIGVIISAILNLVLKGILKQPRPSEDLKEFNLAIKNGHRFVFKNGIPHDIFGMPSGHSQSVMFTVTYISFALENLKISLSFLFIALLTMVERVIDNQHTFMQIVVGGLTGVVYGYLFYYFAQQKIKGVINEKPDDNGPL